VHIKTTLTSNISR